MNPIKKFIIYSLTLAFVFLQSLKVQAELPSPLAVSMSLKEAIEETGRAVSHKLERYLSTLATIATVAPLLGLFGTIIGMVELFSSRFVFGIFCTNIDLHLYYSIYLE